MARMERMTGQRTDMEKTENTYGKDGENEKTG